MISLAVVFARVTPSREPHLRDLPSKGLRRRPQSPECFAKGINEDLDPQGSPNCEPASIRGRHLFLRPTDPAPCDQDKTAHQSPDIQLASPQSGGHERPHRRPSQNAALRLLGEALPT